MRSTSPDASKETHSGRRLLKEPMVHVAFLTVIVFASYSRAFFLPFVWDDHKIVETNPLVQQHDGVFSVFEADFFSHSETSEDTGLKSEYFRPLTVLSFWLEARVGGATIHHVVNLALHLFVVLLFRKLLVNFGISALGATAAALFFALNPIQTETVYWISARSGLLDGLFTLLAVLAAISSGSSRRRFVLVGVFCLGALLSKETGVLSVLAIVALLLAYHGWNERRRRLLPVILATGSAVIVYVLLRHALGVFLPSSPSDLGAFAIDIATASSTLIRWIVIPFNLSAAWDYEPLPTAHSLVVCGIFGLLFFLCVFLWKRGSRLPLVGLVIFLGHAALIGYSSRNIGVISERFAYLPTAFFTMFVVGLQKGTGVLVGKNTPDSKTLYNHAAVILLITVFFSPVIWLRSQDWRSEKKLFASAIEVSGSSEAMRILGIHLAKDQNGCASALPLFLGRLQKVPSDAQTWNNAAACSINLGRYTQALRLSQKALGLDPSRPQSWLNVATSLVMTGKADEALAVLDLYESWENDSPIGPRRLPKNDRFYNVRELATKSLSASRPK